MNDSEVLRAAADVIKNGFTKDAYARVRVPKPQDRVISAYDGRLCSPIDPDANCFCMIGAVVRVLGSESIAPGDAIVEKWVVPLLPKRKTHTTIQPGSAREWNDEPTRTQEQVANMLDAAADVAKLKGG